MDIRLGPASIYPEENPGSSAPAEPFSPRLRGSTSILRKDRLTDSNDDLDNWQRDPALVTTSVWDARRSFTLSTGGTKFASLY